VTSDFSSRDQSSPGSDIFRPIFFQGINAGGTEAGEYLLSLNKYAHNAAGRKNMHHLHGWPHNPVTYTEVRRRSGLLAAKIKPRPSRAQFSYVFASGWRRGSEPGK